MQPTSPITQEAKHHEEKPRRLNKRIKCNEDRFPEDFLFQLTEEEWENLMPQIATSKIGRGGLRVPPDAFTQEGGGHAFQRAEQRPG